MARRSVTVDGTPILVNFDEPAPAGGLNWAIVRVRLEDEVSGRSPITPAFIRTSFAHVRPRLAGDGLLGLVGVPQKALPMLRTQAYSFDVTVGAPGYLAFRRGVTIAAQPGFPGTFTPVDLGTIALHREPTTIRGRLVLKSGAGRTPIAGGSVRITGIWRTPPPPNVVTPASPPNILALYPPLSFARTAAAGSVSRRDMIPVFGEDKHLTSDFSEGARTIHLSDRVGLGVGSVLIIDPSDPGRTELIAVGSVTGAADPALPALVTLDQPLSFLHRRDVTVRRAVPQAPGPAAMLNGDAIEGDTSIFVSAVTVPAGAVVEISGGPNPAEFRVAGRYVALSNAEGYYRLAPLSRVAQIEIEAADGGVHPAVTSEITPLYGVAENMVDLVLV